MCVHEMSWDDLKRVCAEYEVKRSAAWSSAGSTVVQTCHATSLQVAVLGMLALLSRTCATCEVGLPLETSPMDRERLVHSQAASLTDFTTLSRRSV